MKTYFGKYRGMVINNVDPQKQGRLQVSCPDVLGPNVMNWAMPCVPFAGPLEGFLMLPMIGASVWVEFEAGDPDLPIWAGCFWGPGQTPPNVLSPTTRTIKTLTMELSLDDVLGLTAMVLPPTAPAPATVRINALGIELSLGKSSIRLDPARVSVNNGALEVI